MIVSVVQMTIIDDEYYLNSSRELINIQILFSNITVRSVPSIYLN